MVSSNFILTPGELTLEDLELLKNGDCKLSLNKNCINNINKSRDYLESCIENNQVIYGVNTGFGLLANQVIEKNDLAKLQDNIILSHATGVGKYLSQEVVRIILILKINSLAMGYSGIRLETIDKLIYLYNNDILPCIPEKGSVGASGDLAPLAHLVTPLLGEGEVYYKNKIISAKDYLLNNNIAKYEFAAKEGLALLNGTQVTCGLLVYSLLKIKKLFNTAIYTGALSVDAACGSIKPFDKLISKVRNQSGQVKVAKLLTNLLEDSEINQSHNSSSHNCNDNNLACKKVQDPYSLRCQPQVMGACLQQLEFSESIVNNEINAVTDNPLVFATEEKIISGGNFHAEPLGFAADNLALVLAEMGSLSERRIALLLDPHFSSLPAFLVNNSGINSGFMIAQVTAASLVSENKQLANPTVIDSIPTSANQEDHVSMATYGARRLITMAENCQNILAIELLCASQGIEFRRPLKTSNKLEQVINSLRESIKFYEQDRYFYNDLVAANDFINKYSIIFACDI